MKNKKRSAFTIVELVIVIAVIAILSAVLIPTFGAIIKDANIAADQAAAATLTSELHVYLKGNTIDSEEELMAALNDEKLGFTEQKLTPKAAAYGMHFWFDMDNQMILAKTAKEIKDLVTEKKSGNESSAIQSGVQLISDVQPLAQEESLNINFRSILGGNFFIIDKGGSSFANALNTIAEFSGTSHADLVTAVNNVFLDVAADDQAFVDEFKATLASTVIITENALLQPESASRIYFDPAMKFVNAHGTISKITSGTVQLPDSVIGVATGSLIFGSENVVLSTSCKDASDVEKIFANASTNATIRTATGSFKISDLNGNVTVDETDAPANMLVPTDSINPETNKGNPVEGIVLSNKLACEDFEIYAEAGVPGDNTIKYNTANNEATVYVSYLDYATTGKTIKLSLIGDGNPNNIIEGANSSITWSFNGENKHENSITDNTTVTATARNIYGETLTKTLNIVVVKPTYAELKVNGQLCVKVGSDNNSYTWNYSGRNDSVEVDLGSIIYNNNASPISPEAKIELSVADGTPLAIDGTTISLVKNNDGSITSATHTVNVTINDCLTTTFNVVVNDNSDARLVENFRYTPDVLEHGNARAYYVANDAVNTITFGNLFKYEGSELLGNATVKFYLTGTTDNATKVMVINIGEEAYTGSYAINDSTNKDWLNKTITFDVDSDIDWNSYKDGLGLTIEITPEGTDSITASGVVVMDIVLVNGTNVLTNDPAALKSATTAAGDIVMFSDVTLADTANSANYTLVIDAEEALYGNGYKINADKYVAASAGVTGNRTTYGKEILKKWCLTCNDYYTEYKIGKPDCRDQGHPSSEWIPKIASFNAFETNAGLIILNGVIDNIYIDGPVYSTAQYHMDVCDGDGVYANTQYYVSGIKAVGNAKIYNSYVSGFRNPVQISGTSGTTVTLDNTTLYGGSLANLSIVSGNAKLKNVTTVQDPDNADGTKIGAGIFVEGLDAVASKITIEGELYQYNWFCEDYTSSLPAIDFHGADLNLSLYAGLAFNDAILDKMGELIFTTGGKKYLNTGVIYLVSDPLNSVTSDIFSASVTGGTATWASREASLDEVYAMSTIFEAVKLVIGPTKAAFSVNTYSNSGTPAIAPNSSFATSGNYYVIYYGN